MIHCGLALYVIGDWIISQLKPELHHDIRVHRNHFDGMPVLSLGQFQGQAG